MQLASALVWKEALAEEVTFAPFDTDLWGAAGRQGLDAFPEDLPQVLEAWNAP